MGAEPGAGGAGASAEVGVTEVAELSWGELARLQDEEFRGLLSRQAWERAEWWKSRGRDPRQVMSLEQLHLAGLS